MTIAIDAWRQDRAAGLPPTSCRILWDLRPGFMVALGKELDLRLQRVRDTRTRVDELASDIWELVKHANKQRHGAGRRCRSRRCGRSSAAAFTC